MKRIIFLLVLSFTIFSFLPISEESNSSIDTEQVSINYLSGDGFCEGFKEGYQQGWCYNQGMGCIPKIAPPCPIPNIGESTYKHGYNNGFARGYRDNPNKQ